jgi:DNA-binding response OmpR family regulator
LPLRSLEGSDGEATAIAEAAAEAGSMERNALVIEDDDQAADLLRLLLEAEGFAVLRVANADAALQVALQQALSLITIDLDLADIDGMQLLLRLRENAALATVPVVIVAAAGGHDLAIPGGAATVLQKPVSRAELKIALHHLGFDSTHKSAHTVLIVDDDPKAVEVIAAFLPAPAYAVVRAYGGAEAITLARKLKPDLILLDLIMPEVSGFDVIDALALDASTARIPILVVTSMHVTTKDLAALNSNAEKKVHVLEKAEFNQTRFIAEVRRALSPP